CARDVFGSGFDYW
nr:immunoglobulin heavy chain junction region [Macaca mulatta]MOV39761.1 immunoglobulin heavy chain junction region [Macaca mulatta]MOV42603.1 immunoglobulin heavy chain junction region [Macaca mulatta]MOV43844.1 immunoglobulin heavy chain junction region [Macaca mulatta]MOV45528.1 immunoglobulin heavy chain junction region [Macaca mulatta]